MEDDIPNRLALDLCILNFDRKARNPTSFLDYFGIWTDKIRTQNPTFGCKINFQMVLYPFIRSLIQQSAFKFYKLYLARVLKVSYRHSNVR